LRGFGTDEGHCDLVKVTRPELPIYGGVLCAQSGELNLHSCAVSRRGERDLDECACRHHVVGSLTIPADQKAVRGIDFDVLAADDSPAEVKVERVARPRSRHEMKRWMASLAWS